MGILARAIQLLWVAFLICLPALAQSEDFEVRGGPLPANWAASSGGRFVAKRQQSDPELFGLVEVWSTAPTSREQLEAGSPPLSSQATASWESGRFQNYSAYIYRRHEAHERENYQGSIIDNETYYVVLNDTVWARINVQRSCSMGRAVMLDGSEIPPGTVPMVYERKFIAVDAPALMEELRSQQEQILNSLRFELPEGSGRPISVGSSAPPPPLEQDEIPWGTLVGVGTGAIVAAGVAAALKKKPAAVPPPKPAPKQKEKSKKPPDPVAYVLQVSADHLEVVEGRQTPLAVSVWRVDPVRLSYLPAQDAVIEVTVVPPLSELTIARHSSPGKLACQLGLKSLVSVDHAVLQVRAQVGGSRHGADIRLSLGGGYELVVTTASAWSG